MSKPLTYTNYKGQLRFLNMKEVTLRSGRVVQVHYFTTDFREDTALINIPEGWEVVENPKNGFVSLQRSKS